MSSRERVDDGGRIARRAVIRWAARLLRREWHQQVLVVALLAVAVATAVGVSTAVYTLAPAVEDATFGSASHRFTLDDIDPAAVDATIAAARAWFDDVEVIRRGDVRVDGRGDLIEVREQDPAGPLGAPMLALRKGRYPARANELAVAEALAGELDVDVGSILRIDGGVEMRVVGLVENPNALSEAFLIVSSEFGAGAPSVTLLVNSDDGRAESFRGTGDPIPVYAKRGSNGGFALVAVLAMTEVALVLVSLIAAAGFAAMAQRRQRQLGMLAAIGATEEHLRLVTLSNGALVGAVASLVGAVVGLVTWFATAPVIGERAGHRLDRFEVPWWLVVLIVVLAIATTTAAAWWPARIVARVPITEALAGRRPRPQRTQRSIATSVGSVTIGLVALAVAGDVTSPRANGIAVQNALLVATGTVAIIIGVLLLSPFAIGLVGNHVRELVLPVRLALRDLARYQTRSAAALAAISLALGIPLAVTVAAASAEHGADTGNLSSRQLVISTEDISQSVVTQRTETELQSLDRQVRKIASSFSGAQITELQKVVDPRLGASQFGVETIRIDTRGVDGDGPPVFLASDDLLNALGVTAPPGFELITAETGAISYAGAVDPATGKHPPQAVTDPMVIKPAYTSLPSSLLSPEALTKRGWTAITAGWLIETREPLTRDQIAQVRTATLSAGLPMETRDDQTGLVQLRNSATAVGMALALGILAMTVGLLRSEATHDLQTLTATGATSSIRRAITASTAAGLAVLGVLIATTAAYAAITAASKHIPAVPLTNLAAVALGVPLLAGIAGWLAAGREPESLTRQAIG
jgi:putative ABC transport system permease protein